MLPRALVVLAALVVTLPTAAAVTGSNVAALEQPVQEDPVEAAGASLVAAVREHAPTVSPKAPPTPPVEEAPGATNQTSGATSSVSCVPARPKPTVKPSASDRLPEDVEAPQSIPKDSAIAAAGWELEAPVLTVQGAWGRNPGLGELPDPTRAPEPQPAPDVSDALDVRLVNTRPAEAHAACAAEAATNATTPPEPQTPRARTAPGTPDARRPETPVRPFAVKAPGSPEAQAEPPAHDLSGYLVTGSGDEPEAPAPGSSSPRAGAHHASLRGRTPDHPAQPPAPHPRLPRNAGTDAPRDGEHDDAPTAPAPRVASAGHAPREDGHVDPAAVSRAAGVAVAFLVPAWIAWALYHRIRGTATLKSPVRRAMLERLDAEPGAGVRDLAAAAGVTYTTACYHLKRLEDEGFVVREALNGTLGYYRNGGALNAEARALHQIFENPGAMRVLSHVTANPGTYRAAVAGALRMSVTNVNWYLKRLVSVGLVKQTPAGRRRLLHADTARLDAAREKVATSGSTPAEA